MLEKYPTVFDSIIKPTKKDFTEPKRIMNKYYRIELPDTNNITLTIYTKLISLVFVLIIITWTIE